MSQEVKVGDIVGRRSYNSDTMFRIEEIVGDTAYLKGSLDWPLMLLLWFEIISWRISTAEQSNLINIDTYHLLQNQMRSYDNGDFILVDESTYWWRWRVSPEEYKVI